MLAILAASPTAATAVGDDHLKPRYWGPHYHAPTQSYFSLYFHPFRDKAYQGPNWIEAKKLAESHIYKGVRGRLAIVRSKELNDWLLSKFNVDQSTWIGLRHWCRFRKLLWVDGTVQRRTDYKNWHRRWYRAEETRCAAGNHIKYMPVYYRPENHITRWQASGEAKRFPLYLVEFPTGGE